MTRIEKLLPPSRPNGAWTAVLSSGLTLRLPEGTAADFALFSGMELDEETLAALKGSAERLALREKAAALLSARMLSAGQLREKLTGRGGDAALAEETVRWAQRVGLVDDRQYAAALVWSCQRKGYGLYRIRDELYRRRVPRELWEEALSAMEDPAEVIDRFLEKRLDDPEDRKQLKRASDALARRGFSWSQISEGLERARERLREER